jgi:hypothetical protein
MAGLGDAIVQSRLINILYHQQSHPQRVVFCLDGWRFESFCKVLSEPIQIQYTHKKARRPRSQRNGTNSLPQIKAVPSAQVLIDFDRISRSLAPLYLSMLISIINFATTRFK